MLRRNRKGASDNHPAATRRDPDHSQLRDAGVAMMLPGDWLALFIMVVIIGALTFSHLRAVRNERRAQRELDRVLGHPARIQRATRDARVMEQPR
jgi:hypothetical protein